MGEPTSDRIAIVGMGGVFPGAPTLDVLWQNVCDGVDAITDVPPGRWDPVFYDPAAAPGRTPTGPGPGGATATATVAAPARVDRFYCRRGGFVDDVAHFDPTAFGIMPIVVDGGEPDQFLALAQAAAALDDAGGVHERVAPDRIGVVVGRGGYRTPGIARLDQRIHTVQQLVEGLRALVPQIDDDRLDQVRHEFVRQLGPDRPEASIGLVPNLAASRIANRFDFQGPAFTVDAACASALVAIDHGLHELTRRRCDLVVAGGAHHCHDVTLWSVFTQLKALSPSQGIRPFSRRADGILIGEGTGFFVLKRLADAERDGDRVYAVVCGSGIASDGRSTSLMSPNPSGQVLAIERAWQAAGFDPATVGLIEAHGTGTPAGDEAELDSLRKVFGSPGFDQHRAGLGSIKSMIGHAMPAAGAAGLAKAALALHHGVLPPTLHVEEPHPQVEETRFRLITDVEPWAATGPRRAGVNAFGFGGINAHLVLEEHGATRSQPTTRADRRGRASTAPSSIAGARRHDTTNGRTAPGATSGPSAGNGPAGRIGGDPGPDTGNHTGIASSSSPGSDSAAPGTDSGAGTTARSNNVPGTPGPTALAGNDRGESNVGTGIDSGNGPSACAGNDPGAASGPSRGEANGTRSGAGDGAGTAARTDEVTRAPDGNDTSLRSGTAGASARGDDAGYGTTGAAGTIGAQARSGTHAGTRSAGTRSAGTGPTGRATAMTGAHTVTGSGNVGHAVAGRRGGTAVLPATLLLAGPDPANLGRRLHEWVVAHDAATSAAPERPSAPPSITDVPEQPGPARLAVVGVDARRLELAQKVVAQGKPWRGRNGVWFEPRGLLHDGGKVAFLFPGVEPTFDPRVDDVAAHFGLEPLAATLVDDRASDRSPLECQSRGILAVGRLLDAVLGRLGIRPDMVAGHSLGEWSGELASGVIADDLFADVLERLQPGAIKVADVVFVALGCGADTAAGLLTGLDGTVVSHDNCTRQSVVCGPPGEISVVVDRCKARRVLAQELPFRSGFHSPLFAAHVPALRAALGSLSLRAPRIPLWSATTCRPYPDDVEGVRDLATRHLVEPVRFRQLTLALHDAGARVFVQVGVGNLTGFVDDTLHGRDAMTIAANSAKRSGLDQLCHVAAALWVQGRAVAFAPLANPPGQALRSGRTSAAVRPARASLLDLGTRLVRDLTPLDLAPPVAEEEEGVVDEQEEVEVEVEAPAATSPAAATAPAGLVTTR
ncbi:MAG TPA: beta-ketoacyl synthase N-terminal-like domain-containing protein, partial [Acidimicrobiales bacterium]|nr:beta-ketoacyl synthase N-terminal-like domain-containing protein [Acidimicrobiales bacterium]